MARKPMIEGGTKKRILEVGGRQIFERGYEATSIRGIMQEVGGEVGLFYYYYKTKDDLFTDVLDHFFEPYRKDFEAFAAEAKEKPYQALLRYFSYIKREVRAFRAKYEGNMHRTVRWAIREQTLTVIEPYLEDIIRTLMTFGAKPKMEPHTMAIFLAHGVGSCILHEDADWVDKEKRKKKRKKLVSLFLLPAAGAGACHVGLRRRAAWSRRCDAPARQGQALCRGGAASRRADGRRAENDKRIREQKEAAAGLTLCQTRRCLRKRLILRPCGREAHICGHSGRIPAGSSHPRPLLRAGSRGD